MVRVGGNVWSPNWGETLLAPKHPRSFLLDPGLATDLHPLELLARPNLWRAEQLYYDAFGAYCCRKGVVNLPDSFKLVLRKREENFAAQISPNILAQTAYRKYRGCTCGNPLRRTT